MASLWAAGFTVISATAFLGSRLLSSYSTAESPLATLFIQGAARTLFETGVFLAVCAVLFALYESSSYIRGTLHRAFATASERFALLSNPARLFTLFLISLCFIFALNTQGILQGYFHADDFAMTAHVVTQPIQTLIWTPYSQHAMPLNWVETALFFHVFGTNPIPYNIFLLLLAATLPLFGFLVLREFGYDEMTFFLLLILYGGSVVASEFLAGFYVLAIYPQVLLFFLIAIWSYTRAHSSKCHAKLWLSLSFIFLFVATFFDISGIWTTGAYVLFAYLYHLHHSGEWSPWRFLRTHTLTIAGAMLILCTYGLYLLRLASVQTEQFLGSGAPLTFGIFKQIYDAYTAGTIAQLFLPSAGLIMSQPRFLPFLPLWDALMLFFLLALAAAVYAFMRYGGTRARAFGIFALLLMLGTGLLTALGRPTTQRAAFFPIQQIVMPFFWLTMFLTVALYEYAKPAHQKTRAQRTMAIVMFCMCVLAAQHVFGFYKDQNVQEVRDSRRGVTMLQNTLVPALNDLAMQSTKPLYVPDVRGLYINPYLFGRDASQYKAFLALDARVHFLDVRGGPYAASTSPQFVHALLHDEHLRAIYLKPIELEVAYGAQPITEQKSIHIESDGNGTLVLWPHFIAPKKQYLLTLDLEAPESPEKAYIQVSFKNTLMEAARGTIRLDQYSRRIPGTAGRRYAVIVDLNEMYAFALSPQVSDITLTFVTPGVYTLYGSRLDISKHERAISEKTPHRDQGARQYLCCEIGNP